MRRLLTFALVSALAAPALASAQTYEMKDLEALEKQEAWQEAVQHLGDIPPSKRNDAWQRIAEKSASGYLAAASPRAFASTSDDLVKRYPTLKKSKPFMQARADAGITAFKATFSDSHHNASDDPWFQALKTFVDSDPMTADLPMKAGKLVSGRLVAYMAMPFFKKAVLASPGACKDADVKAALVSAVVDNVWADDARDLINKSCYADTRAALEAALAKGDDDYKKRACAIFAQQKASIAACK